MQLLILAAFVAALPGLRASPVKPRAINSRQVGETCYDYVIVGGGASGLVLGNRLTADGTTTVLIIEAGPIDAKQKEITIPYYNGVYIGGQYDWNITSVAQSQLDGLVLSVPDAKVLAGASAINGMQYDRGSKGDYDAWEDLGNEGWNWESLLPYFIKTENFTGPSDEISAEYGITWDPSVHGTEGYIQASYPEYFYPQSKTFFDAMNSLGHPTAYDAANGSALQATWGPNSLNHWNQSRSYAREYYDAIVDTRSNYHVLAETRVTRLLTETSLNGTVAVTGVKYAKSQNDSETVVYANKEVIMASGALHTPQLLQISGIGDQSLIESLGVESVLDLPGVGQNLQGHVYTYLYYDLNEPLTPTNLSTNESWFNENWDLYYSSRKGALTVASPTSFGFLPLSDMSENTAEIIAEAISEIYLDVETPTTVAQGHAIQQQILSTRMATKTMASNEICYLPQGTIMSSVTHPYSRGTVKAATSETWDDPTVDPRYLSNPGDLAIQLAAVKYLRKIMTADAFAALGTTEQDTSSIYGTDDEILEYIKNSGTYFFHISGTCSMMPQTIGGVVDTSLKVYGTSNLRIVDASILPMLPGAHILSTVYAVAEKAADIIISEQA